MPVSTTDLSALSRTGGSRAAPAVIVSRPPSRVLTRVLVPLAVVLAVLGLLAYAARESLRSAIVVNVAPAVLRMGGGGGTATGAGAAGANTDSPASPGEIVQAPGWIEADPSAIGVPALASGVLKELTVLDGDRVEAGQIVALLVDDDARLALRRAQAEVVQAAAAIAQAKATVDVEEARVKEATESLNRVEHLTGTGAVAEGEIVDRRLKLASQAASAATARAAVTRAQADEQAAQVGVDQAQLELSRMTVRSPVAGVVLQRLVEPGHRLMPDANNEHAGVVVRIYDPAHLQVRVDVPLADAAKVRIGDSAEITTETLPGRTFKGTLTRFVHEANLQKNTVQVKVAIADPAPELKPDMLAKAKIASRQPTGAGGATTNADGHATSDGVLVIPRAALIDITDTQAAAWVVDRETSAAVKRTLRLGQMTADSADVLDGLRIGDRVILNPSADLKPGAKVRPADEPEAR